MNAAVNAFFLIFKLLSLYFLAVSLFCLCGQKKPAASAGQRRFAILIAARNEESCIAGLIESLRAQDYPSELFDIWVLPNNCTDRTAEVARRAGAKVMEMPAAIRSKGAALHAAAVITTATDAHGKFSVDAWAARNDCAISDMALAKAFSAAILERDLPLASAFPIVPPLPGGVYEAGSGALGVYIGCDVREPFQKTLRLIPKKLRVGLGCRRGVCASAITSAIRHVFAENRLDLRAISGVFSIDLKKDEPGLLMACRENGWSVSFYPAQTLQAVPGEFTSSSFVASVTGVDNVCERAAMVGAEQLLVSKTAMDGVTVAVALEHWEVHFG